MLETANIGRTAIIMMMVSLFAMAAFTGTAAAQIGEDDVDTENFICDNEDTQFVAAIQFLMGAFFIGSFALSIVSYSADKMNDAAGGNIDVLDKMGSSDALKSAILLPIGVWAASFVGNVMFGYDLTCIMPLQ